MKTIISVLLLLFVVVTPVSALDYSGPFIWGGLNTGYIHGPNEEKVPNGGIGLIGGWNVYKWLDAEIEGSLGYYDYKGTNFGGTFALHFRSRAIVPLFKIKSIGVSWIMGAGLTLLERSDGIYIDENHDFMNDRNPYLTYEGGVRFEVDDRFLFELAMEHVENINHHDRGVNFVYLRIPFFWE